MLKHKMKEEFKKKRMEKELRTSDKYSKDFIYAKMKIREAKGKQKSIEDQIIDESEVGYNNNSFSKSSSDRKRNPARRTRNASRRGNSDNNIYKELSEDDLS
uniref:Uncharacterized protein n=1 Tax=Euplotes crassus TaxID=5936 RepID=A0A7S3KGG3_EUPCR|mmetsp:Transcript_26222/g.26118  ORF Transcript_26222/g.26118 Transcript_26222/m.26118 type:complete len:102 (+) Transcript_26222:442-747(+)